MRRVMMGALLVAVGAITHAADSGTARTNAAPAVPVQPSSQRETDEPVPASGPLTPAELDKVMYAIGQLIGSKAGLDNLALTPHELAQVVKGLSDAASGKPSAVDMTAYQPKVQALAKERAAAALAKNKAAGLAYLEKAASEPGVTRTATGIVMKTLLAGTGASPEATDNVKVNYEGHLISGKVFDSSAAHGGPATFRLNQVVACWTAAVQMMKVGGKAQIVCPAETAYGDRTMGDIKAGSTLVFNIELLDIMK